MVSMRCLLLLAVFVCSMHFPVGSSCAQAGQVVSPDGKLLAEIKPRQIVLRMKIGRRQTTASQLRITDVATSKLLFSGPTPSPTPYGKLPGLPIAGTGKWTASGRFFVCEAETDSDYPYRLFLVYDRLNNIVFTNEYLDDIAVSGFSLAAADSLSYQAVQRDEPEEGAGTTSTEDWFEKGKPVSYAISSRIDFLRPRESPFLGRYDLFQRVVSPDGSAECYELYRGSEHSEKTSRIKPNTVYVRGRHSRDFGVPIWHYPRALEDCRWSPDSRFLAVYDSWDTHAINIDIFEVKVGSTGGKVSAKLVHEIECPMDHHFEIIAWHPGERRITVRETVRMSEDYPYHDKTYDVTLGTEELPSKKRHQYFVSPGVRL